MRTRQTQALVKEAIFNILGDRIIGASLLDLYAGKGGVGLYALEKGAERVVFIELNGANVKRIRERLGQFKGKGKVYKGNVLRILKKMRLDFGVIFLDPPYNKGLVLPTLRLIEERKPSLNTIVIVEHHSKERIPQILNTLRLTKIRRYGETSLSIYEMRWDGGNVPTALVVAPATIPSVPQGRDKIQVFNQNPKRLRTTVSSNEVLRLTTKTPKSYFNKNKGWLPFFLDLSSSMRYNCRYENRR